jgi:hypothetical protein
VIEGRGVILVDTWEPDDLTRAYLIELSDRTPPTPYHHFRTTDLSTMRVPTRVFCFLALHHVTHALKSGNFCPSACAFTLGYPSFNDTDTWLAKKVRSCRSELHITSLYLCFDHFCEDDGERENWISNQRPWCDEHAGVALPAFHDVVDRWSVDEKARLKRLDAQEAMSSPVLGEVVLPDDRFFDRAFTTMDVAFRQYNLHLEYG